MTRSTPPRRSTRRALLCASGPLIWSLVGCAQQPPAARPARTDYWSGRLSLQLHDEQAAQQSFSASFELQGSQEQGQLILLSPFGAVLAQLLWSPGNARLRQEGQRGQWRESPSLDALLQETLGTTLPLGALFAWLAGRDVATPGWQADLGQLPQGRLRAERTDPLPRASLRLILDR